MIIKSSQRGYRQKLADHLTKTTENEKVDFSNSRFVSSGGEFPVHQALSVMELLSSSSLRCKNPFYHISINPDDNMSDEQWSKIWDIYEEEFGLENQAFVEVTHTKKGRSHRHRVYNRVNDEGKAIHLPFTRLRNEKIARRLEYEFHHPLTVGRHNRAVINRLKDEGREEIARWMEEQKADIRPRPVAQNNPDEDQQQKRTKIDIEQVKADLQWAYEQSENGWAFLQAIARKGYMLARGNRRDYVVVDKTGNVHSPRRRLGVKAQELKEKWADLPSEHLLTVDEVKAEQLEVSAPLSCPIQQAVKHIEKKQTEQNELPSDITIPLSVSMLPEIEERRDQSSLLKEEETSADDSEESRGEENLKDNPVPLDEWMLKKLEDSESQY